MSIVSCSTDTVDEVTFKNESFQSQTMFVSDCGETLDPQYQGPYMNEQGTYMELIEFDEMDCKVLKVTGGLKPTESGRELNVNGEGLLTITGGVDMVDGVIVAQYGARIIIKGSVKGNVYLVTDTESSIEVQGNIGSDVITLGNVIN